MGLGSLSPSRISDSGSPEASDSVYAESPHCALTRQCAFAETFLSRPAFSARGEKYPLHTRVLAAIASAPRAPPHTRPSSSGCTFSGQQRSSAPARSRSRHGTGRGFVFSYSSSSSTQSNEFEYGTPRKSRAKPKILRNPSGLPSTLSCRAGACRSARAQYRCPSRA